MYDSIIAMTFDEIREDIIVWKNALEQVNK